MTTPGQWEGTLPETVSSTESPGASWRSRRLERLFSFALEPPVILAVLVSVLVSRGITQGEFFFDTDETRHAMNGVFFRDFISDHAFGHALRYVYEYYAKYPALAFPHWPPLYHFAEGIFFLLFGLSPLVSRITILGFALLGAYFWYQIATRFGSRYLAFLSAVTLVSVPCVLLYERLTMLEIPALASCLGAIYFWLKFIDDERQLDLWALAGWVVGAFLISQKAIFLVFFIAFDLMMERRFRLLKRLDVWLALLAALVAVLPWYLLASRTMSTWFSRLHGSNYGNVLTASYTYLYYPLSIYRQLGPLLLSLAGVGFVLAILKRTRTHRVMLVWLLSGYICFTLITEKDPRHTILWLPPLIYLGFMALETLLVRRTLALVASSAIALVYLLNGVRSDGPKLSGVEDVARYVLSLPESDLIYYQGDLNGDFIFFVREFDPEKRHMVAREKQIVVSRLGWRPQGILSKPEDVVDFFQNWGIRYAVVEDQDPVPGLAPVRELLNSDQFELLRTFPVRTNQPNFHVHQIQVFRYRGQLHRTQQALSIPMMTIRHNIPVDLSRLVGRPWPN